MRQIIVSVPIDRSDLVVDVLQQDAKLDNVVRLSEGGTSTIYFYCPSTLVSFVLKCLDRIGCGVAYGRIALMAVEVVKPLPAAHTAAALAEEDHSRRVQKSRLSIEEIYSGVRSSCMHGFDYYSFVIIGGIISGVGLAVNSTIIVVAAMLISPLMGPIVSFTFGTVVKDLGLIRDGLWLAAMGFIVTWVIGFLVGIIFLPMGRHFDWPTDEMLTRGEVVSLYSAPGFAVPAGVGVALSVTGQGGNSMVGFAIAASLAPPAANSGMALAFGLFGSLVWDEADTTKADPTDPRDSEFTAPDIPLYLRISAISAALFFLNVIIIYSVAVVSFWFKKVQPVRRELSTYLPLATVKTEKHPHARADSNRSAPCSPNMSRSESLDSLANEYIESKDAVKAAEAARSKAGLRMAHRVAAQRNNSGEVSPSELSDVLRDAQRADMHAKACRDGLAELKALRYAQSRYAVIKKRYEEKLRNEDENERDMLPQDPREKERGAAISEDEEAADNLSEEGEDIARESSAQRDVQQSESRLEQASLQLEKAADAGAEQRNARRRWKMLALLVHDLAFDGNGAIQGVAHEHAAKKTAESSASDNEAGETREEEIQDAISHSPSEKKRETSRLKA